MIHDVQHVAAFVLLGGLACSPSATQPSQSPPSSPPSSARLDAGAAASRPAADDAALPTGADAQSASSAPPRTPDELVRACDQGTAGACIELAQRVLTGDGVPKDPVRARSLVERTCKPPRGTLDGCVELSSYLCHGWGGKRDTRAGITVLEAACDARTALACSLLGLYYTEGLCDVPYNGGSFMRGAQFYMRACDGGNWNGCVHLGNLYLEGKGVARDATRGRQLLELACKNGETHACRTSNEP